MKEKKRKRKLRKRNRFLSYNSKKSRLKYLTGFLFLLICHLFPDYIGEFTFNGMQSVT